MSRIPYLLALAAILCFAGCSRSVDTSANWQETGAIKGFDGQTHPVRVSCHEGRTTISSATDCRTLGFTLEAVYIGSHNIRTVERSPDGLAVYEVIYALDEHLAVIDISRDLMTSVTLSSLSR